MAAISQAPHQTAGQVLLSPGEKLSFVLDVLIENAFLPKHSDVTLDKVRYMWIKTQELTRVILKCTPAEASWKGKKYFKHPDYSGTYRFKTFIRKFDDALRTLKLYRSGLEVFHIVKTKTMWDHLQHEIYSKSPGNEYIRHFGLDYSYRQMALDHYHKIFPDKEQTTHLDETDLQELNQQLDHGYDLRKSPSLIPHNPPRVFSISEGPLPTLGFNIQKLIEASFLQNTKSLSNDVLQEMATRTKLLWILVSGCLPTDPDFSGNKLLYHPHFNGTYRIRKLIKTLALTAEAAKATRGSLEGFHFARLSQMRNHIYFNIYDRARGSEEIPLSGHSTRCFDCCDPSDIRVDYFDSLEEISRLVDETTFKKIFPFQNVTRRLYRGQMIQLIEEIDKGHFTVNLSESEQTQREKRAEEEYRNRHPSPVYHSPRYPVYTPPLWPQASYQYGPIYHANTNTTTIGMAYRTSPNSFVFSLY